MKKKAVLALTLAGLVVLQTPMTSLASTTAHVHHSTHVDSNENRAPRHF